MFAGGFLTVLSKPVFASNQTVDLYSVAYQQEFDSIQSDESIVYEKVADAFVTFVAFKEKSSTSSSLDPFPPVVVSHKCVCYWYQQSEFRPLIPVTNSTGATAFTR